MPRDSSPEDLGEPVAEVEVDAVATPDLEVDANAAESSDADGKDAKAPRSTLDVVTEALGEKPEKSSDSVDGKDGEPDPKAEKPEAAEGEGEKAEGEEQPPFHQHPRWQAVQKELKTLRPQAEAFNGLQTYMRETGLSVDEANQGFQIMSLLKSDPAKAYEALAPIVASLQQHVGVILPTDLQEKVDGGYMTEEDAREFAQLRSAQKHTATRTQAQEAERQKATQNQATESAIAEMDAWETEWKASDPDYAVLNERVAKEVQLTILTQGFPATPKAARALVEKAKTDVIAEVGKFRPKPKPIKTTPQHGHSSSAANQLAPKNTLEVVERALAEMAA